MFQRDTGGYLDGGRVLDGLYAAMDARGYPRVGERGGKRTFHSFRNTFARIALESGAQLDVGSGPARSLDDHADARRLRRLVARQRSSRRTGSTALSPCRRSTGVTMRPPRGRSVTWRGHPFSHASSSSRRKRHRREPGETAMGNRTRTGQLMNGSPRALKRSATSSTTREAEARADASLQRSSALGW